MKFGIYKHYKGNTYKILSFAKDSETLEEVVVYQDIINVKKVWVRPKEMFREKVKINGEIIPRFKFIKE